MRRLANSGWRHSDAGALRAAVDGAGWYAAVQQRLDRLGPKPIRRCAARRTRHRQTARWFLSDTSQSLPFFFTASCTMPHAPVRKRAAPQAGAEGWLVPLGCSPVVQLLLLPGLRCGVGGGGGGPLTAAARWRLRTD